MFRSERYLEDNLTAAFHVERRRCPFQPILSL